MDKLLNQILREKNRLVLTIDCEGIKYDSNIAVSLDRMNAMVEYLEYVGIKVIVFLAPGFVQPGLEKQLSRLLSFSNLLAGLHLHLEDLPGEVGSSAELAGQGYKLLTDCPFQLKAELLAASVRYLQKYGIGVCGFRGGFFAMDNEVADILKDFPQVLFESHNIYRQQYLLSSSHLQRLPVLAQSAADELRIERFELARLLSLFDQLKDRYQTRIAITHSYLFKDASHLAKIRSFVDTVIGQDISFASSDN